MNKLSKILRARYGLLLVAVLIFGAMIIYIYYQASLTYNNISGRWGQIMFAYNHPAIVEAISNDYASKSAQLDSSYSQKEPTAQDRLIDQVATQLQKSK